MKLYYKPGLVYSWGVSNTPKSRPEGIFTGKEHKSTLKIISHFKMIKLMRKQFLKTHENRLKIFRDSYHYRKKIF